MRSRILDRAFFNRPTITVARDLLGKFLVVKHDDTVEAHVITETEAYIGARDKASHAHRGKTARNLPMFGPPGHWYVYFIYGMYWMLNIVTERDGNPEAVLIRGVKGITGPGRLTRRLRITKQLNGRPATEATALWIEDRGEDVLPASIRKGPRVGIDYAGPYWKRRHLRFWIEHENKIPRWIEKPSRDRKGAG